MTEKKDNDWTELDALFDSILDEFADTEHGAEVFRKLNELFAGTFDTDYVEAVSYLKSRCFFREPVAFQDVADSFWNEYNPKGAESPFPFLQGDLIHSRTVVPPTGVALPSGIAYWQVLSRDCDLPKVPWIRVAPVYSIPLGKKSQRKGALKDAALFRSPRVFAMPPIDEADLALYSDFTTPCFIAHADRNRPDQVRSLTPSAWHLFASVLVARAAKADIRESMALRSIEPVE